MRPLILDDTARARIAEIKRHAERNVVTLDDIKKAIKTGNGIGDDPAFVLNIHFGFRVVYSLEDHPGGRCHHLSMSVPEKGRSPSIQAVQVMLDEFGIKARVGDKQAMIWMEQGSIVNVLVPVSSTFPLPAAATEATSGTPSRSTDDASCHGG